MSETNIVAAVEIGTSKIAVLVGEVVDRKALNLIGFGQSSSEGVIKGEVSRFRAVGHALQAAFMSAEKSAGSSIDKVYLAQSGRHLDGLQHKGSVNVSSPDNRVSQADIQRAVVEAKGKQVPEDRVYIHHIRNHYLLDDRQVVEPLGMEGEKLEVNYWSIHGDKRKVRDHIHVVNGYGLDVEDLIVSSVASASMVLSDEEKQGGALVLDVGGGTTDWALYLGGYIVRTGVLAVGGEHLINDLALGLRIDSLHAEKILHQFGDVRTAADKEKTDEMVWMVGDHSIGDRQISRKAIRQIIQARLDEMFSIISRQLGTLAAPGRIAAGVVITGGVSALPGIDELAARVFCSPARVGELPRSWISGELNNPAYSTILGLMHYALTGHDEEDAGIMRKQRSGGLLRKMAQMLGGARQ